MGSGLYAGSFDPIHRGHVQLIEAAASGLDRLFVAVAGNPQKTGALLSLSQRAQLITAATAHLPNVEVAVHRGLVVDLARQLRVDVLVRGMGKEQKTELQMFSANKAIGGVPTLFFPPAASTSHISSRVVRERMRRDGVDSVGELVPAVVLELLRALVTIS